MVERGPACLVGYDGRLVEEPDDRAASREHAVLGAERVPRLA